MSLGAGNYAFWIHTSTGLFNNGLTTSAKWAIYISIRSNGLIWALEMSTQDKLILLWQADFYKNCQSAKQAAWPL